MDKFYLIVGSIAIIILILVLLFVGIKMIGNKTATGNNLFPPMYSSCPDYWTVYNGQCKIPDSGAKNIGSLRAANYSTIPGYKAQTGTIDFNDTAWAATGTAICSQKKWANSNGISWDGVTNYNGC